MSPLPRSLSFAPGPILRRQAGSKSLLRDALWWVAAVSTVGTAPGQELFLGLGTTPVNSSGPFLGLGMTPVNSLRAARARLAFPRETSRARGQSVRNKRSGVKWIILARRSPLTKADYFRTQEAGIRGGVVYRALSLCQLRVRGYKLPTDHVWHPHLEEQGVPSSTM